MTSRSARAMKTSLLAGVALMCLVATGARADNFITDGETVSADHINASWDIYGTGLPDNTANITINSIGNTVTLGAFNSYAAFQFDPTPDADPDLIGALTVIGGNAVTFDGFIDGSHGGITLTSAATNLTFHDDITNNVAITIGDDANAVAATFMLADQSISGLAGGYDLNVSATIDAGGTAPENAAINVVNNTGSYHTVIFSSDLGSQGALGAITVGADTVSTGVDFGGNVDATNITLGGWSTQGDTNFAIFGNAVAAPTVVTADIDGAEYESAVDDISEENTGGNWVGVEGGADVTFTGAIGSKISAVLLGLGGDGTEDTSATFTDDVATSIILNTTGISENNHFDSDYATPPNDSLTIDATGGDITVSGTILNAVFYNNPSYSTPEELMDSLTGTVILTGGTIGTPREINVGAIDFVNTLNVGDYTTVNLAGDSTSHDGMDWEMYSNDIYGNSILLLNVAMQDHSVINLTTPGGSILEAIVSSTGGTVNVGEDSAALFDGDTSTAVNLQGANASVGFDSFPGNPAVSVVTSDIVSSIADVSERGQTRTVSFNDVDFQGTLSFGDANDTLHIENMTLDGPVDLGYGANHVELANGGAISNSTSDPDITFGSGTSVLKLTAATFDGAVAHSGTGGVVLDLHGGCPTSDPCAAIGADATFEDLTDVDVTDDISVVQAALAPANGTSITSSGTLIINGGSASLAGDVRGDSTGTLAFSNGSFSNPASGGVYSSVSLALDNATFTTATATDTGIDSLHAISVLDGSTFNVNADVSSADALTVDNSTVNIAAGKTLAAGSMNGMTDGTLSFGLDDDGTAGRLTLTDGGIILQGATVKIDLTSPSTFSLTTPVLLATGTATLIGFDGSDGQAATEIGANTALWTFYVEDGTYAGGDDTQLYVVAERDGPSIAEVGAEHSPSNASVGATFDGLSATTDPQLLAILTKINAAPTDAAINAILSSVKPTGNGAAAGTLNMINNALNLNSMHLDEVRQTGLSGGTAVRGMQFWTQAFGQTANQGMRGGDAGFEADTAGFAAGIDSENLVKNAVIGAAVDYGHTNVNSSNGNSTGADINSYQLTAYGEYDFGNKTYFNAQASYAFNKTDVVRYDVGGLGGLTARGSFDADQYALRAETGHSFQAGATTLTPKALAHWAHYSPDDYTETGAGGASLAVNQKSMDIFELGGGLDASWKFRRDDGAEVVPAIRAGYRYDLIGDSVASTSTFAGGGTAFSTEGASPARGTATLGAGLKYALPNAVDLTLNYDFEHKADYNSNSGYLRVGYSF